MSNFFYITYNFFKRRKTVGIIVFVVLFLSTFFLASKISFEEDILKLIPKSQESKKLEKVLNTTNFSDKLIVKITRKENSKVKELISYASELVDSISKHTAPYIKSIEGKIDDSNILNTTDFIYKNLPLFLSESDYIEIKKKLKKENIESLTRKNFKTLVSPTGSIVKKQIIRDPLGLTFLVLNNLKSLSVGDNFILKNGFLMSKDEENILLFINTQYASSETAKNTFFINELKNIAKKLTVKYEDEISGKYYGATVGAVENATQIKSDIQITVSIALSILIVILIVFYKKITIPFILFIPTLFGGVLAVAVLFFIRGKVSAISLGIGSVLLGITLDYSLHILTFLRNEGSVKKLYNEICKPILISSLTTASAFLCLLFINSQALQDLGIFAAISVIGASLFALFFIPHVYTFKKNKKAKQNILERIVTYKFHTSKILIIGSLLLIIISCFTYKKVSFNQDLSALNYKSDQLIEIEKELDGLINISKKSIYLVAYGNSEEEALQINERILRKLQKLKNENKIIEIKTISNFIGSEKSQNIKSEKWKAFWTDEKIEELTNNIEISAKKVGFKPTTFSGFINKLSATVNKIDINTYKESSIIPVKDYIVTKNGFTTITNILKVEKEFTQEVRELFKDNEEEILIDRKEMNEVFLGGLKNNFNSLMIWSFLVVAVLLLFFYRNIYLTLISIIPVFLTWVITVGLMGLLKVEFNIFNIIISTFIFGLGIDYSIFITNALVKEYQTKGSYLPNHKIAILLSVLTTILGVGVLIFAKHPALYSISIVSVIGIISAIFIAFTIQPLLFKLFIGTHKQKQLKIPQFIFSILSFTYFGVGGIVLSLFSVSIMKIIPISKKKKMKWFHKVISKFMGSVLWSYPFLRNKTINEFKEDFSKQALIIANHNSFLDILTIGKLHPKLIFLVNDWVYNSPIFGKAVQLAGFYPVSAGIENGLEHLEEKIKQGYSVMVFPEGTRSETNKIKRFHKGAFYLAEKFKLDIIPVLIHGASEVLPKTSFIINKGTITTKILKRISSSDVSFGVNYSERTKKISTYFKEEHNNLREELEDHTYFYKTILESYQYKEKNVRSYVKKDFKKHIVLYNNLLKKIAKKTTIIHVTESYGGLDFLLTLNSLDRKVFIHAKTKEIKEIIESNYLMENKKIKISENLEEVLLQEEAIIIIDRKLEDSELKQIKEKNNSTIFFIKDTYQNNYNFDNYTISEEDKLVTLKR
ncbi:1-acyl-sn-glycerol-3-phosphate acyltransferase [Tenacibaculum halocynthiae]|uniref:1-acyl-sn-glycerol-3-phosphate acyltransferase n=1 Tax=Tenacibaculum halocynthiae TaxID=1254437 RepID=UPI003894D003